MSENTEYYLNNYVHIYMDEVASRIIAASGIPTDRYHLGKVLLQNMRDDPDFVMQIDGSTGERETNGSALERCIRCAVSLTQRGVSRGDVAVLMAPNHLHLAVPFYAALFLGVTIAPIDRRQSVHKLKDSFDNLRPKIVFCQKEKVADCKDASKMINLDSEIISFDESDEAISFAEFLSESGQNIDFDGFKASDLDPDETIAFLLPTSGTTGLPKFCKLSHKNMILSTPSVFSYYTKFPSPVSSVLVVAPLHWLSTLGMNIRSVVLKFTRIQSPLHMTPEHTVDIIKKFQPAFMVNSPTMMTTLLKVADSMNCDFSCFDMMCFGGTPVPKEMLLELKKLTPKTQLADVFGMTEIGGLSFIGIGSPLGSCGKLVGHLQYKLVSLDKGENIKEPNKQGELWLKSAGGFKGYNDPKATANALSEDGWIKTGDLMYHDENSNFFYVDRIKLLLEYKYNLVSPMEIESVIRQHPDVLDVAVSGALDDDCGELIAACVVQRPGRTLTAQDIHGLVRERLDDTKQLRGGVIFLSELPLTATTKLHRRKVREIVTYYVKANGAIVSNGSLDNDNV